MHSARLAFLFLQRRIGADALAWAGGLISAVLLRYDFDASRVNWVSFAALAGAAVVVQVLVGLGTGLYLGRWRLGSFEEVSALVRTVAGACSLLFLVNLRLSHRLVPLSVVVGGGVIAFVLMGAARYLIRSYDEDRRRPTGPDVRRLLVFGAGDAGAQIVASLLRDPSGPYLPVALLDDDPAKRNLRIMGVPVVGGRSPGRREARRLGADTLRHRHPRRPAPRLSGSSRDLALDAGLEVKVLPRVGELFGATSGSATSAHLTEADLLGRHEVDTDVDADRRLPHRQAGARHRRRRLDRLRAVPPDLTASPRPS